MCMFCAAIPAAVALGANAHRQQKIENQSTRLGAGRTLKLRLPAAPVTALVVAGLLAGSIAYHSTVK